MRLLLDTYSTNEHYNADCDYAVVIIDTNMAKELLQCKELLQMCESKNAQVYQLVLQNYDAGYISTEDWELDEVVENPDVDISRMKNAEYAHLKPNYDFPECCMKRTTCDALIVTEEGVYWRCTPKHTDISITTTEVPWDLIVAASQEK